MDKKHKILILCSGNSCRSQMAEAFFQKYAPDEFEAYSAGLEPRPIHPLTIKVMNEIGIDISSKRSKSVREYLGKEVFSFVIFVCGEMEQNCPHLFPLAPWQSLSWPFPDPASFEGDDEGRLQIFREVRDAIEEKIKNWLTEYRNKNQ